MSFEFDSPAQPNFKSENKRATFGITLHDDIQVEIKEDHERANDGRRRLTSIVRSAMDQEESEGSENEDNMSRLTLSQKKPNSNTKGVSEKRTTSKSSLISKD